MICHVYFVVICVQFVSLWGVDLRDSSVICQACFVENRMAVWVFFQLHSWVSAVRENKNSHCYRQKLWVWKSNHVTCWYRIRHMRFWTVCRHCCRYQYRFSQAGMLPAEVECPSFLGFYNWPVNWSPSWSCFWSSDGAFVCDWRNGCCTLCVLVNRGCLDVSVTQLQKDLPLLMNSHIILFHGGLRYFDSASLSFYVPYIVRLTPLTVTFKVSK